MRIHECRVVAVEIGKPAMNRSGRGVGIGEVFLLAQRRFEIGRGALEVRLQLVRRHLRVGAVDGQTPAGEAGPIVGEASEFRIVAQRLQLRAQ